jgi:hypothetical protein
MFFFKTCLKCHLLIMFRHDVQYKTRLVLEMIPSVGMENIYIDLNGIGSYDEKLEAVLSV